MKADLPIATSSDGWLRDQFAGQAMLTLADLNALPINDRVLELLPEKVARDFDALPASYSPSSLHVILPDDMPLRTAEVLQQIKFILNREITFDVADREALRARIDLHYSAFGSAIQNCPRTFAFRCPRRWVDLERGGNDDRVRHCPRCDTSVRLCKDDEELKSAVQRGECVAYYESSEEFLGIVCDEP